MTRRLQDASTQHVAAVPLLTRCFFAASSLLLCKRMKKPRRGPPRTVEVAELTTTRESAAPLLIRVYETLRRYTRHPTLLRIRCFFAASSLLLR